MQKIKLTMVNFFAPYCGILRLVAPKITLFVFQFQKPGEPPETAFAVAGDPLG
nr:MAG TPA: Glutaredoxin-2-fold, Oxidoreductase, Poxvirus, Vaccinia Virus [Bacteriophage sp.]